MFSENCRPYSSGVGCKYIDDVFSSDDSDCEYEDFNEVSDRSGGPDGSDGCSALAFAQVSPVLEECTPPRMEPNASFKPQLSIGQSLETEDDVIMCPSCCEQIPLRTLTDDETTCPCGEILQSQPTSRGHRYIVGQEVYFTAPMSGVHYDGTVHVFIDTETVSVRYNSSIYRGLQYNETKNIDDVGRTLEELLENGTTRTRAKRQRVDRYSPQQVDSSEDSDEFESSRVSRKTAAADATAYVSLPFYKEVPGRGAVLGHVRSCEGSRLHVVYENGAEEDLKVAQIRQLMKKSYVGRNFYSMEEEGEALATVQEVSPPGVRVQFISGGVTRRMSIDTLEKWTGRSYLGKWVSRRAGGAYVDGEVVSYSPPNFTIEYTNGEKEQMTTAALFKRIEKCFVGRTVQKDFGESQGGVWSGHIKSFNALYFKVKWSDGSAEDYGSHDIVDMVLPREAPPKKTAKVRTRTVAPYQVPAPQNFGDKALFGGLPPLCVEVVGGGDKSNLELGKTFISQLFDMSRILILKQRMVAGAPVQRVDAIFHQFGGEYSLVGVKKRDEGMNFSRLKKEVIDFVYVRISGTEAEEENLSLTQILDQVADFASIRSMRKLAARLELFHSCSQASCLPVHLAYDDFELIDDSVSEVNQEYMGDGCGFIGEQQLASIVGGAVDKLLSIQVRIFCPRLGIFKGELCKKPGIDKIQLTPSMLKVGPSVVPPPPGKPWDWATIVVVRVHPSCNCAENGRVFAGKAPPASFYRKPLSPMVQRLMRGLGCPQHVINQHYRQQNPDHAWLVGLADPTGFLPEGRIFITGFKEIKTWATRGACNKVFVTRSPCVLREHGRMLPVVVERPPGMPLQMWNWLLTLPFGGIIFSTAGNGSPLAATVASGDLDGDLYMVCWDKEVIPHIADVVIEEPIQRAGAAATLVDPVMRPVFRNPRWLEDVQAHFTDEQVLSEHTMIGRLYKAMEKVEHRSKHGMSDPDYVAYAKAYIAAVDFGKHDLDLAGMLPQHLRGDVGL